MHRKCHYCKKRTSSKLKPPVCSNCQLARRHKPPKTGRKVDPNSWKSRNGKHKNSLVQAQDQRIREMEKLAELNLPLFRGDERDEDPRDE